MDDTIAFEKALKGKFRAKKIALIAESNPRSRRSGTELVFSRGERFAQGFIASL